MTQEFIPYEQALALKELGFDEPCFGEYRQWDGDEPWLQLYQDLSDCSTDPADYEYTQEALAPTFSQAFRWFRTKYGLYSWITMELGATLSFCWIITGENKSTEHKAFFKSYEEAELACLIKLIEIVKNK